VQCCGTLLNFHRNRMPRLDPALRIWLYEYEYLDDDHVRRSNYELLTETLAENVKGQLQEGPKAHPRHLARRG
jgi:hypothetical protein